MPAGELTRVERGGRATGGRALTERGRRTRRLLVSTAAELFEATPYDEVRLSDITAAAGVSAGTFYTYFDTKEQIFREVAQGVLTAMSEAGALVEHGDVADPIEAVAAASRQYFVTCLAHREVVRSMERLALGDPDLAAARRAAVIGGMRRVDRFIRQLQLAGVCDPGVDPWDTAMVLHTTTVRVAYDHLLLPGHHDDVEQMVTALCQLWTRTLRIGAAAGRATR